MGYSDETERYVASVVAVGGEWPARVNNLRITFPDNEPAFKEALNRYVYAAHGQKAPPTAVATSNPGTPSAAAATAGLSRASSPANPATQSVQRIYPGQQAQTQVHPAATAPNTPSTSTNNTNASSSSVYIPYAKQYSNQALATFKSQTRVAGTPASSSNTPTSASFASRRDAGLSSTANTQPRAPSSLNPTALRPPKTHKPVPVSLSKHPLPPYFPISVGQAYMTTYPSRVKLGLTTLMQPLSDNGKVEPANAQASAGSSSSSSSSAAALLKRGNKAEEENSSKRSKSVLEATPTVLGKRQRNRVDYRERIDIPEPPSSSGGSEDEGDENDTSKQREGSTDAVMEDDSKLSRAARAAKRNGVLPPAAASARDSPAPIAEKDKKAAKQPDANTANVGKSWLAQNPPANLIMVQPAKRHMLPYVPQDELELQAQSRSLLVPIRLEFDLSEGYRIRDYFTWNLSETSISPEMFSKIYCLDLDISFHNYGSIVASSIKSQLEDWMGTAEVSLLTPEQEQLQMEADLRVIVNIDVQLGQMHLIDRIEWDLTSSLTPEEFATQLCSDIGLGGESIMIISHAIHEELLRLKKDCLESGVLANMAQNGQGQSSGGTGMGLGKLNVAPAGPKKLAGVWRDWNEAMSFGPHVEMLLPDEIDALESEKERNPRRTRQVESASALRERTGRRR